MVNSIKVAADFLQRLPKDGLAPETTAEREGFVHPNHMDTAVDRTSVRFIIRDFDTAGLADKESFLERLARATVADWPGASVECEVRASYRNMREVLDRHPEVVAHAEEAMRRVGLAPRRTRIRGGTDGSILSAKGLPTPNLSTGQHAFHSRLEWVTVEDLEKAVEVVVELVRVWEERGR
jgi:tripeptide aminopeptidase